MTKKLLFIIIGWLMVASLASASPIVYSQPFDPNSVAAYNSTRVYSNDHSTYYEHFKCYSDYYYDGSYAITDFHWWGVDLSYADIPLDGFSFEIWKDDGAGSPNSMVYSEFVPGDANETFSGYQIPGAYDIQKYDLSLSSPWAGGAGNYWFSVEGVFTESVDHRRPIFYWAMTDASYDNPDWQYDSGLNRWGNPSPDLAFEVTGGSVVPEPATLLLFGLGLLGSGRVLRRKRNR